MVDKVEGLPKIELHRHIEGCIDTQFLQQHLEQFYPNHKLLDHDAIANLFTYSSFNDFLEAWATVMSLLNDYEHFRELARYVISQLNHEKIVYAELLFSPQPFVQSGLNAEQLLQVMYDEFAKSDVDTRLIVDFVRNFGSQMMEQDLPNLIDIKQNNDELGHWIQAVSIGGDEVNYPATLFSKPFKQAKEEGFHLYAHSGEWTDAASIWEAINKLNVERIGHGIKAVQDKNLIKHLKTNQIGLDISITSNFLTAAVDKKQSHPISELYQQDCVLSINTDDPGFFHTDLNYEYQQFIDLGYTITDAQKVIQQAVTTTFTDKDGQEKIKKKLR